MDTVSQPSNVPDQLTFEERAQLLKLARQALEEAVHGMPLSPLHLEELPPRLQQDGFTFVTLTNEDQLRGCVGSFESKFPLAEDVRQHAIAAAFQDYRFPPVQPDELAGIKIEISCLTEPISLDYICPEELLSKLQPYVDGVVLKYGMRRATFLPQVWEKIPDPALFLSMLCQKMGAPPDLWQRDKVEVFVYHVEKFHE